MTEWLVLLPQAAAQRITGIGAGWGNLNVAVSQADHLAGIVGVGERDTLMLPTALGLPTGHPLAVSDTVPLSGVWHRGAPELQTAWLDCRMRSSVLTTEGFRAMVTSGWVSPPVDRARFTLIYAPGITPEYSAWWVDRQQARPADLDVLSRPGLGWAQLEPGWPVETLRGTRVAVIGVGSIGAAAADALAGYGIGTLSLVDPDRLLSHNLIRHPLTARDLGRSKVTGLAGQLHRAWPETTIEPPRARRGIGLGAARHRGPGMARHHRPSAVTPTESGTSIRCWSTPGPAGAASAHSTTGCSGPAASCG